MPKIDAKLGKIFLAHSRRYPLWEIPDLYKLIHQAAMGSEHAIQDEIHVRRFMAQELDSMGDGPVESFIDPLSPDGHIVRVHLRPLIQLQLEPELLLHAFIRTGREVSPSKIKLLAFAKKAIGMAQKGQWMFSGKELADFVIQMRALGYPAVHHSRIFEETYRPAYRVVARDLLPLEWLALA